jgi:hypothetical protein
MPAARHLAAIMAAGTLAFASLGMAHAADSPATLVVPLRPVANAAITGTATFVDLGNGKAQVIVTVSGTAATDAGPVDLRDGSCPVPGAARQTLTTLSAGTSSSEVPLSVADLKAGHVAVVVHHVPPPPINDATGILACGTIAAPATASTTDNRTRTITIGGTIGTVVLLVAAVGLTALRGRQRQRSLVSGATARPRASR